MSIFKVRVLSVHCVKLLDFANSISVECSNPNFLNTFFGTSQGRPKIDNWGGQYVYIRVHRL